jgi:predicted negative regulator of RcsB-dependent stress response
MEYRMNTAQKALSGALEIYNSPVVAANSPEAKESKKKTYTDEKEKYKQAAQAFETVANSYSVVGSLARYYAAISRSHFDPPKAQTELEAISKETSEIGTWAKVSLAESYAANEQVDKAIAIYQQIKDGNATLPKTLVLYSLGRLYERQSKTNEATEAYVQTATADRNSSEGRKAIERLNIIAPEKVKNLPPEKADDEWFK